MSVTSPSMVLRPTATMQPGTITLAHAKSPNLCLDHSIAEPYFAPSWGGVYTIAMFGSLCWILLAVRSSIPVSCHIIIPLVCTRLMIFLSLPVAKFSSKCFPSSANPPVFHDMTLEILVRIVCRSSKILTMMACMVFWYSSWLAKRLLLNLL